VHFKTTAAYKKALLQESEANWVKADLVLQDIPASEKSGGYFVRGSRKDLGEVVTEYAAAVGEEASRIVYERRMAVAWPKAKRRARATWGAHAELMSHPERFDLIKKVATVSEARALLDLSPSWTKRQPIPKSEWEYLNNAANALGEAHDLTRWTEWREDSELLESGLAAATCKTMIAQLTEILAAIEHFAATDKTDDEFYEIVRRSFKVVT
jgi:hypothetical protein